LLVDHLRRRPRRDQRVEPGDGAAGDGDECERKQRARHHRPAAADVARDRRHLENGIDDDHAEHEQRDRADLHVRAEIVARRQQQPHRQHRGDEAVARHQQHQLGAREDEVVRERRGGERLAEDDREDQQRDADDRRFTGAPRPQPVHVDPDEQRQRDRHADGEGAPRAVLERVDHGEPEAGEGDDDDEEDGEGGGAAGDGTNLGARDVGERAAPTTGRAPQDDHVVDGAGEADAADQPDQSRRVAELRREHGADERARAGNCGKMVTEQHPSRSDVKVLAIGPDVRGRGTAVVEAHHARGDERAVVPVGDREDSQDRQDDVKGPHLAGILAYSGRATCPGHIQEEHHMRRNMPVTTALTLTLAAALAAQGQKIKVTTESVPVYVTVTDLEKRLVPYLVRKDFEILDNGKVQTVNVFSNQPVPITTTVMIDTSGSMTTALDLVKDGAEQFLLRLLPRDKAQVGEFSDKIKFHPGSFIDDRDRLVYLLKNDLDFGYPTRLYDAGDESIERLAPMDGRQGGL